MTSGQAGPLDGAETAQVLLRSPAALVRKWEFAVRGVRAKMLNARQQTNKRVGGA